MTKIIFKCPKCGSDKIEEILDDITVATGISNVKIFDDGRIEYDNGEQTNEGGHVDRYQCGDCGFTIVDDKSPHADDGLDEHALVKAIQYLNNPPKKGDLVSHGELVHRIADGYDALSGEELATLWNELFPATPVVYDEVVNTLFWVKE